MQRWFLIQVISYDWNCPQYITPRFTAAEVEAQLAARDGNGGGSAMTAISKISLDGESASNCKSPATKKDDNRHPFVPKQHPVRYKTIRVNELDIFYREAGPQDAPTILLLHGFPTSSNMFRNLIPRLATSFHVCARLSRLRPKQHAES